MERKQYSEGLADAARRAGEEYVNKALASATEKLHAGSS